MNAQKGTLKKDLVAKHDGGAIGEYCHFLRNWKAMSRQKNVSTHIFTFECKAIFPDKRKFLPTSCQPCHGLPSESQLINQGEIKLEFYG